MIPDSHESSCGEAVVFEVTTPVGTKLQRRHVGVFVRGRSLINVITRFGLVRDYVRTVELWKTVDDRKFVCVKL